ncbi:invasion associated locus B family protein [Tropicimonas sp. S265A]|uniref:invasion associated locus B family protein n=1 Tax=Tropicimonas sp. S265A TaxID=3415134 RepID=UPI003C7DF60F
MIPTEMRPWARVAASALLAMSVPFAAMAQDETAPETPSAEAGADQAQPAPQRTQPYFLDDIGDWRVRCVAAPIANTPDVCQLYQLLLDANGNSVAEFTILPTPDADGAALATIVTPLETLLPPGLRFSIDGSPAQSIPFTWCNPNGCYVRFRLGDADVDALKAGGEAGLAITPLSAPDREVALTSSLRGFTRAFDTVAAGE